MANVKLYLDTRSVKKDGTSPIKIVVTHNGSTALISTGISVLKKDWNATSCKVIAGKERNYYNNTLLELMSDVTHALIELRVGYNSKYKTASIVANDIKRRLSGEEESSEEQKEGQFMAAYMDFIAHHENPRTQQIYQGTWNALLKYDPKVTTYNFENITKKWIEDFYLWYATMSPSVNARNIHLRNIRAVFNNAIDNELTDLYPFRRIKIRHEATRKRNLPPATLRQIFDGQYEEWQQKYIDLFKLSFMLIGINIGDLLSLKSSDLHEGRIYYKRKKTKRLYDIKVEPEALSIINKYRGKDHLLSFCDRVKNYKDVAAKLNNCLKSISSGVTTYYARHSWATIAASLDISTDTIAAGLGHGGNTITDIYIERDHRKVDKANRQVIDYVLYNK